MNTARLPSLDSEPSRAVNGNRLRLIRTCARLCADDLGSTRLIPELS